MVASAVVFSGGRRFGYGKRVAPASRDRREFGMVPCAALRRSQLQGTNHGKDSEGEGRD